MTLDEALKGIGRIVIYDDGHGTREEGTIVDVRERFHGYAKMRYGHNDCSIKSTPLEKLSFL